MLLMITLISCCLLVVALNIYFLLYVRRQEAKIVQVFVDFISSPDAETPSPFAQTVVAMARVAAPEFTQSMKGSMMGQASAVSKAIEGIEEDVAGDALAKQNPAIAALLAFSPSLAKRINRSPAAALALSQLNLGNIMKGSPGNGSKGSKSEFKLG